jgi:Uncharacterized conserved protein
MKYDGSCHCGKIAFTVDAGDALTEVYDCNCSMCRRRGGLLWFAPAAALTLHTDRADLGHLPVQQGSTSTTITARCAGSPRSARAGTRAMARRW